MWKKRVVTFTSTSYNIGIPNPPKQRVFEKYNLKLSRVRPVTKNAYLQKGVVEKNLESDFRYLLNRFGPAKTTWF